jgi:hypothetical protein
MATGLGLGGVVAAAGVAVVGGAAMAAGSGGDRGAVRLAYQPPASSIFLSEQISHQQPASSTFLSEQTSTSHQPPAKRTRCDVLLPTVDF